MGLLNRLGLRRPDPPRCFAEGRFQIAGVTVINPMHDRRAGATLDISSGAIAGISDTAAVPPSEFAGCFALPGLVDMHVHLPPDNALKLTQGAALLYLLHGVTSIREAGDLDGTAVAAARRLSRGAAHPVPRVFSCGPFVGAGKATFKNTILLEDASPAAADAAALRVKADGASFMKFYEGLTEPMIRSLERACARHGLKMMGHLRGRTHRRGAAFFRRAGTTDIGARHARQSFVRLARGRRTADGWDRRGNAGARHCQYADPRHQPKDALLSGL